jgi:hypothetical protein
MSSIATTFIVRDGGFFTLRKATRPASLLSSADAPVRS